MYRLYIRSIARQLIGEEGMIVWPSRGDVKSETGSEVAAQDKALQTNYLATKILQTETAHADYVNNGTVDHTISAWPILGKEQYIKRHDRVCAQLQ